MLVGTRSICRTCTVFHLVFVARRSLSYQYLYLLNVDCPIGQPSVTERRQDDELCPRGAGGMGRTVRGHAEVGMNSRGNSFLGCTARDTVVMCMSKPHSSRCGVRMLIKKKADPQPTGHYTSILPIALCTPHLISCLCTVSPSNPIGLDRLGCRGKIVGRAHHSARRHCQFPRNSRRTGNRSWMEMHIMRWYVSGRQGFSRSILCRAR